MRVQNIFSDPAEVSKKIVRRWILQVIFETDFVIKIQIKTPPYLLMGPF